MAQKRERVDIDWEIWRILGGPNFIILGGPTFMLFKEDESLMCIDSPQYLCYMWLGKWIPSLIDRENMEFIRQNYTKSNTLELLLVTGETAPYVERVID